MKRAEIKHSSHHAEQSNAERFDEVAALVPDGTAIRSHRQSDPPIEDQQATSTSMFNTMLVDRVSADSRRRAGDLGRLQLGRAKASTFPDSARLVLRC